MFNPFLNRESGLEAIGKPKKSVRIEFGAFEDVSLIRRYIRDLMDFGIKKGVRLYEAFPDEEDTEDLVFIETVCGLEKHWENLMVKKIDGAVVNAGKIHPGNDSNVHFMDSQMMKEILMNTIEHGIGIGARNEKPDFALEAYSSEKGIFWIAEQRSEGEQFLAHVEPILADWPPPKIDFTYTNGSGRKRGAGLTSMFSSFNANQVSYEFIPPHGLKVYVLKQFA